MEADGSVKSASQITEGVGGFPGNSLDNTGQLSNSTRYQGYFGFGSSLANAGDWDGDNLSELIVGNMTDDEGGNNRGSLWFLHMNSDGTVKPGGASKIDDAALEAANGGMTVLGNNDYFGASVEVIGDINGDSIPDLMVGAPADDDGGGNAGAVYVLFMNADATVQGLSLIHI